jgi:excisionase family DNA binding protein
MPPDGRARIGVTPAAVALSLHPDTIRTLFDDGILTGIRSKAGYRMIDTDSVNNLKKYRTCTEAAHVLGCSTRKIQNLFDAGTLWGYRTAGGRRRIDVASLVSFIEHQVS